MDSNQDKPWLDPKWNIGIIKLKTKSVWLLFLMATIFIIVPVPIFHTITSAAAGGKYFPLLIFIFPFIGFIFLVVAVYYYRVYKRFRGSTFELNRVPGVIGGELIGKLIICGNFPLNEGLTIRLINLKTVVIYKEPGKIDKTRTHVVYDDKLNVNPSEIELYGSKTTIIPVKFKIPYDTFDPRDGDKKTTYQWFLSAEKVLDGPDLDLQFEIPVFKTEDSNHQLTRMKIQSGVRPEDISLPPGKRRILVDRKGLLTVYKLSAWPGFGVLFGFSIFYALTLGSMGIIFYQIIHGDWFGIFVLPFILLFVLLASAMLYSFSGSKAIWFENNQLHRQHNFLGHKSRMSIPCRSIQGFNLDTGGNIGAKDLYRVQLTYQIKDPKEGKLFKKSFDLVNLIPSIEEAKWFTALLSKKTESINKGS